MSGNAITTTNTVMSAAETGRVQNTRKSPRDMIKDWRSEVSMMGPRTNASTIGAAGKPDFAIRYPSTPKAVIVTMSMGLLFTPYAPARQASTMTATTIFSGNRVIYERNPMSGSMVKMSMQLPMNMLVTMPQNISGCWTINVGPGVTPCRRNAPRINAITTLSGSPNVKSGMNPLHVAAFAAASGAATPPIAPAPNFWDGLDHCLATAYAT